MIFRAAVNAFYSIQNLNSKLLGIVYTVYRGGHRKSIEEELENGGRSWKPLRFSGDYDWK